MDMIYLIGGAVRTGKSALASKILDNNKISVISTDVIVGLMKEFVKPQDDADPRLSIVKKAENFFPHLENFIKLNIELGVKDFVYEGDLILPEHVVELSKSYEIIACFLGFSQIDIGQLKIHKGNHQWIDELEERELGELPNKIIADSKYIEDECSKYGLKYFDLSVDYEKVHEEAYQYLKSCQK